MQFIVSCLKLNENNCLKHNYCLSMVGIYSYLIVIIFASLGTWLTCLEPSSTKVNTINNSMQDIYVLHAIVYCILWLHVFERISESYVILNKCKVSLA